MDTNDVRPCLYESAFERFLTKIAERDNGCWEWIGALTWQGYGAHSVARRMWRAHRYSFAIHNGYLPAEAFICHTCDNPPCVNPDHLYAGDGKTNIRDMLERNRRVHTCGERDGNAKLTTAAVLDIRKEQIGGASLTVLAARHGVSKSCVGDVLRGRTWKHI